MQIRIESPRTPDVAALLAAHVAEFRAVSPPESKHALDIDALCAPSITFWTARDERTLLGCGALAELNPTHGEIKSMRTAAEHLRRGVASRILGAIVEAAQRRGYERLSLETGAQDHFAAARSFYARHGFAQCGPFGAYTDDPNSVFMTRMLRGTHT